VRLFIKGGRIIDPAEGLDTRGDIIIEDGHIVHAGPTEGPDLPTPGDGDEVLDAAGKCVVPGLVDMHCHLREPGEEHKEDIASGSEAAARGGFTTICAMANTHPPTDDAARVRFIVERGRDAGIVRVLPVGAVTRGLEGRELAEIGDMVAAGAVAVSDDGRPVKNPELMRCALQYATMFGIPVISHCEDPQLVNGGVMHFGAVSTRLGLRGAPAAAEEVMVARDIILAEAVGARLHIAHVSTAGSLELIRTARERGVNVTCEVTPHHLTLTDGAVSQLVFDTNTKVNPPLRPAADRDALRRALADGTIDIIATDHAPHHADDKEVEYDYAAPGISGLETALPLLYTELVVPGILDLQTLIRRMSTVPARLLGLDGGTLAPGSPADITVVDLETERQVDVEQFASRGRNTPFGGWTLRGWPVATVVAGRIAWRGEAG